ncbi:biotin transporter BioY [Litoreibacter roseus]|uniref:Biotin transporter n=1 Tax=Litoreibacter roseus TaxID=2601869 RepID=A0A6N6JC90_9RHOB|nr:biotin transporter BioY [Litoreibacter roseus]GFE63933.1 biotin transporter BioY [Litoreibacter roseus]
MTLTQAALGHDTFLKKALLVLGGSAFIAIAAQMSVPFWPVPLTMQGLAILIVGLSFGARLGAATVIAYLVEGAAGLPVFANGGAGLAYMAGPTAGFLLGFVAMAYISGLAAGRSVWAMLGFGLIAAAALYIPGVAWPMAVAEAFGAEGKWVGSTASSIWTYWVSPFLLGDALKVVIAALLVSGAARIITRKS